MEAVYSTKYNTQYVLKDCEYADIPLHYGLVRGMFSDVTEEDYCTQMVISIDSGEAKACYTGKGLLIGFLYVYPFKRHVRGASVLSVSPDPMGMMLLFHEVTSFIKGHKVEIPLHGNADLMFKALATGDSIRDFHNYRTPIVLMVDSMIKRTARGLRYAGVVQWL